MQTGGPVSTPKSLHLRPLRKNVRPNISRARSRPRGRVFFLIGHRAALKRYRVRDILTCAPLLPPTHGQTMTTSSGHGNGSAFVAGNCLSFCYFAASKSQTSASAPRSQCSRRDSFPHAGGVCTASPSLFSATKRPSPAGKHGHSRLLPRGRRTQLEQTARLAFGNIGHVLFCRHPGERKYPLLVVRGAKIFSPRLNFTAQPMARRNLGAHPYTLAPRFYYFSRF